MKRQEGIFTRVGERHLIFKGGGRGRFVYDTHSWEELNEGAFFWEWDKGPDKLLGTLKVPMEYLT